MPRHSGNRDAADRWNSSVHGGAALLPNRARATALVGWSSAPYLRSRCRWQVPARRLTPAGRDALDAIALGATHEVPPTCSSRAGHVGW